VLRSHEPGDLESLEVGLCQCERRTEGPALLAPSTLSSGRGRGWVPESGEVGLGRRSQASVKCPLQPKEFVFPMPAVRNGRRVIESAKTAVQCDLHNTRSGVAAPPGELSVQVMGPLFPLAHDPITSAC